MRKKARGDWVSCGKRRKRTEQGSAQMARMLWITTTVQCLESGSGYVAGFRKTSQQVAVLPSTDVLYDLTIMKGRHQFKRRFSLQPSFMKDDSDSEEKPTRHQSRRSERQLERESSTESRSSAPASSPGSATRLRHQIVLMGAAKTGKSSIIQQFLYNSFSPKYKRTIEEMHHGEFHVNGVHLTLDILDTSGENEFPAMRRISISKAEAFILVYDICDVATFEEVRIIRDQIIETKGPSDVPIVVVGNKLDLADEHRQVDYNTTESVVTVDWENGFVEASAKDGTNVPQIFKLLLHQAKVKYNLSPALRRRRRQSLPPPLAGGGANTPVIPSLAQLQHLEAIREKHASGGKRNSCVLS